jgi:hypothetical protein
MPIGMILTKRFSTKERHVSNLHTQFTAWLLIILVSPKISRMKTMNYKKIFLEYLNYGVKRGRKCMYTNKLDTHYAPCLFPLSTAISSDSMHTSVIHTTILHAGEYTFHG